MNSSEKAALKKKAAQFFSPRTPISSAELFAGRSPQILKTVGAINQPGAHAIIYGERGVGKTSLAIVATVYVDLNIDGSSEGPPVVAVRVNCDGTDEYGALWAKVFAEIRVTEATSTMGFRSEEQEEGRSLLDDVEGQSITPGLVQRVLTQIGEHSRLIVILDEFDRLPDGEVPKLIADTIKSLSDNTAPATILVVGVGDSVANLVRGHESVRRHLVEVPLPRMSQEELERVITDRMPKLGLKTESGAPALISLLSRGLPYYTHLLGQHAACAAVDSDHTTVTKAHVDTAMHNAIEDSEREMRRVYYEATNSRQPQNFFAQSLAACAMAEKDEFGYFLAGDVRMPMSKIMGRQFSIPHFFGHLERFCDKAKGGILQSVGPKHSRRYRFSDPLMEPFVVIKSLAEKTLTEGHLEAISEEKQAAETPPGQKQSDLPFGKAEG